MVNCLIKHLKNVKQIEDNFPEHNVETQQENCENRVKDLKKNVFPGLLTEFKKNSDLIDGSPKCLMNELESKMWFEDVMKNSVYSASSTMTATEISEKLKELDNLLAETFGEAIRWCNAEKSFSNSFDEMMDEGNKSSEEENENDAIDDYCGRKYAVDNNLIDSNVYNIVLNPENIEVSNVNCTHVNAKNFKELEDALKKLIEEDDALDVECAIRKQREGKLMELVFKVLVLSKLDLTNKQKREEKTEFVKEMQLITKSLQVCSRKNK